MRRLKSRLIRKDAIENLEEFLRKEVMLISTAITLSAILQQFSRKTFPKTAQVLRSRWRNDVPGMKRMRSRKPMKFSMD